MTSDNKHKGACHCGSVKFEVKLKDGFDLAHRCNCSLCRMRGAVALMASTEDFEVLSGEELLTLYQFNTKVAKHYFCSRCGIYTHHQRRSNPNEFGINAACLESISPFDFSEIPVLEGSVHPSDKKDSDPDGIAGTLRFEKTA